MRKLRRALVVGSTGFYGSWLVELLRAEGVEATVIDSRGETSNDRQTIAQNVHDLDLPALIDERGADAVFQLAGTGLVPSSLERPLEDLVRNTSTTLAVLEGAPTSKGSASCPLRFIRGRLWEWRSLSNG